MNFIKEYWVAIVVLVLIVIGSILLSKKDGTVTGTGALDQGQETMQHENNEDTQPAESPAMTPSASSTWQGILQTSDNTAKGNLMLKTGSHIIYLHTSRDFTSLIGKEVAVTYSGNLESFSLVDITAK